MPPRSEPLLWVQLIGAGVFPLEGLLLLLLLAGSDPGPVPGLERLLCWALGALAPTVLLWHRPADVWSLLFLQTPLRARRPLQQRLSRLQDNLAPRLGLALAGVTSLPLLWWLDEHAAVASSLSPLQDSPRLVVLLLAAGLLALMLWQWQQLLQALWLLSRRSDTVAAARPMPQAELEEQRLCLGLPLLLLDPLPIATGTPAPSGGRPGPAPQASPAAVASSVSAPPVAATAPVQADVPERSQAAEAEVSTDAQSLAAEDPAAAEAHPTGETQPSSETEPPADAAQASGEPGGA
jgi:hypothetical protein